MEISDLHKENVIIRYYDDQSRDVEIVPIDLENRQVKVPTQLGGNPDSVQLTPSEVRLIKEKFKIEADRTPSRYLPLSTRVLGGLVQSYKMVETLSTRLMKEFELDQIDIVMSPTDLQRNILINLLNNDIPYITRYQGVVYYGEPKEEQVIGKWR